MKVIAFCTTNWSDAEEANRKSHDLIRWRNYMRSEFGPFEMFMASGSYSNPEFNPLPDVPLINSGAVFEKPYSANQCYALCAISAALWHCNFRDNWDIGISMQSDVLVNCDLPSIVSEFCSRPEYVMAPSMWGGTGLDDNLYCIKRHGVAMYLHGRRRANLINPPQNDPLMPEVEFAQIWKGVWWNPWPKLATIRQDGRPEYDSEAPSWPLIRMPTQATIDFLNLQR